MCHLVVEQVFGDEFEDSMRWCASAVMEGGYCVLAHARLCSVQRILPRSWCGLMHDEAHMRVEHCIGFGSCSAVHWGGGLEGS